MTDYDAAAERAALLWLERTDRGDAHESWATASSLFRAAIAETQWAQAMNAVRAPLGRLVERQLKSAQPTHELPGAPDGDYVVFQFDSRFAHKRTAVETVTPMRDTDGEWRVSGYFIR